MSALSSYTSAAYGPSGVSTHDIALTAAQSQMLQQLQQVEELLAQTTVNLATNRNGAGQMVNLLT
ncbi:hypothetical protein [Aestuariispira ectoiniformans]|uniref:hypothetical protein n=1 Tax=Aestuariispira ectoiniformans TaxID=2775080 RepID=UPI00223A6C6E|nr:hypothetical protein [Aestuariispira ectoiniformans]